MSKIQFAWFGLLIAGVLVSLGYFLIKGYGASNFAAGKSEGISLCNVANVNQGNQDRKDLEKNTNETKNIPDTALDAELASMHVLRDDTDR